MPVLSWGDVNIRISEVSRTSALKCIDEVFLVIGFMSSAGMSTGQLEDEIAKIIASASPAVAMQDGKQIREGEIIVHLPDDDTYTLTLPLQSSDFDSLPLSVAEKWIEASVIANPRLLDSLKNAPSRIAANIKDSQSGSALSLDSSLKTTEIKTTGNTDTAT